MVRNYVRKTFRGLTYSQEQFKEALEKIRSNELSSYAAAIRYKIPRSTLVTHLRAKRGKSNTLGKPPVIPATIEKNLAENISELHMNGFHLSRKTVLELVGVYLTVSEMKNPFKSGAPGECWLSTFEKRHSIQIKPLYVEFGKLKEKDVILIKEFYSNLELKITELGLSCAPGQIWHIEEHNFSDRKIVPKKDMRYETMRKEITVITAVNAEGRKAPMLTVVKGEDSHDWLLGKHINVSHNLGMCRDVFRNYFMNTFMNYIDDNHPNLIIYDAKSSYIDFNLINDCRKAKITLIRSPASVESLGLSIANTLKDKWGRVITTEGEFINAIASTFDCLEASEIKEGFSNAGVYPFEAVCDAKFDGAQLQVYEEYKEFKKNHVSRQEYDPEEVMVEEDPNFQNTLDTEIEKTSYSIEVEIEPVTMNKEPAKSTNPSSNEAKFPAITVKKDLSYTRPFSRKPNPLTITDVDKKLSNWIENNINAGFTVTTQNIADAIDNIATDGKIQLNKGVSYQVEEFLTRNPQIAKMLESKEDDIMSWIDRWLNKTSLSDVNDPKRIFSFKDIGINSPNVQLIENLTVFATASADGNIQEPCVWFHLKTDSGINWTNAEYLSDYIIDSFYPWLVEHNIPLPVILFMDRSTQINWTLSEFCKENHIVLIALPPRLQPLDALFDSLKQYWDERIIGMKTDDFDDIAKELVERVNGFGKNVVYSFKMCGLWPFSPNLCYQKLNGGFN